MSSDTVPSEFASKIWLQIVPREEVIEYWRERLRSAEDSILDGSDRAEALPRALCHVMLAHHYILMQNLNGAKAMQQKFMNLMGHDAIEKLWSYITCSNSEDWSNRLHDFVEHLNFMDKKSSLYFVTVIFMSNEGQMALRNPRRLGSWAWFWLVESAHRLGKLCLKRNDMDPKMSSCIRFCVGSLLLNCATAKDIYAHKYMLKAFSHFQGAIERHKRKGLTRRIDTEIVLNEQSLVAIINMASCFLELRQMDKCTALINQARSLLINSTILDELSRHYVSAFADYVDGVNEFERTSPLHSKLNAGSKVLSAPHLNELYEKSLDKLTRSTQKLRRSFPKSPIFASALTMLGIVTANRAAEFNDVSLAYLQEAFQVEMGLSHRSNTMRYLSQVVNIAAGRLESDQSASALKWKSLYNSVKSLERSYSSAAEEACRLATAVPEISPDQASLTTSSTISLLPPTVETMESNPQLPLVDLQFTDCYRQDCLNYFERRLRECIESDTILAAILCRLFIARCHLLRCAVNLAGVEQNTVREILLEKFSLNIERQNKLSELRKKLQNSGVEMAETVAICCAFWQSNEANIILLNLQLGNNWRLNRSSPVGYSVHSPKTGRYIKEYWYSFSDSVVLRFWTDDWCSASRLVENSRKLSSELHQAFEASTDWPHLGTVLDSSLAESCIELKEMLPSKLLLGRQVKRNAQSLSQSLRLWLSKLSSNNLSDPMVAVSGHRIAVLDDEFNIVPRNEATSLLRKDVYEARPGDVELQAMPSPSRRLLLFQEAYDSCATAGLIDTPLHAYVHLSVAVILYKDAIRDLTKPAYSMYNAAVLKLRRASRVLELLESLHPLTGDCYALLAVMYYNMMQLEDQEEKALGCLRTCLKVQRTLIDKKCTTSRWAWRSIDVARKLAEYFSKSDRKSEWSGIVRAADAIVEMSKDCSGETRNLLLANGDIWAELPLDMPGNHDKPLMAEGFIDPIIAWEGSHHLRETCEAMLGRVYPEDNLPTYTEIMCYSHYLMKLWNVHENTCDCEWIYGCVPKCRMTRTSNDIPRRNDFLNGLNEYTLASPRDKQKILRRLQINHEQLLQLCKPARLFDASYGRDNQR